MQLRVITYPDPVTGEAEKINALFKEGLTCLHLRKPKWTNDQIMGLLEEINENDHKKITFHQMHHMAIDFGLGGVHLKSTERDQKDEEQLQEWVNGWKERGCKISTAIHNIEELERYLQDFDVLTISPIFESISKSGYRPEIDWLTILKGRDLSKAMAIGGISEETIPIIAPYGFKACGVMGAIWEEGDAVENYKKIKEVCEQHVPLS
ncbi:MAG: thiamine phosphate synthase [Flavobacteriales bacterium]|nr:thiamine phosphate synthase [Flavobacteriales bacterium]